MRVELLLVSGPRLYKHLLLAVSDTPVKAALSHPQNFSFLAHEYWSAEGGHVSCEEQAMVQPASTELFSLGIEAKEVGNDRGSTSARADFDALAEEHRLKYLFIFKG